MGVGPGGSRRAAPPRFWGSCACDVTDSGIKRPPALLTGESLCAMMNPSQRTHRGLLLEVPFVQSEPPSAARLPGGSVLLCSITAPAHRRERRYSPGRC